MSAVSFKKIEKPLTISQQIVAKIEATILNKEVLPGQKLPTEHEMCKMFSVSRTALREALRMLDARGLIDMRKGSGIFVADYTHAHASKPMGLFLEMNFDKSYVMQIIEIRQMMEPDICRLAARNRTEEALLDLKQNLQEFIDDEGGSDRHAQLDLEFHSKIAHASGNTILPLIMEPLFNLMPKVKALIVSHVAHVKGQDAIDYHQAIFEKIKAQDEDGAYQAMAEHLEVAKADALKLSEILETKE